MHLVPEYPLSYFSDKFGDPGAVPSGDFCPDDLTKLASARLGGFDLAVRKVVVCFVCSLQRTIPSHKCGPSWRFAERELAGLP
jgi:hypothetical protein